MSIPKIDDNTDKIEALQRQLDSLKGVGGQ